MKNLLILVWVSLLLSLGALRAETPQTYQVKGGLTYFGKSSACTDYLDGADLYIVTLRKVGSNEIVYRTTANKVKDELSCIIDPFVFPAVAAGDYRLTVAGANFGQFAYVIGIADTTINVSGEITDLKVDVREGIAKEGADAPPALVFALNDPMQASIRLGARNMTATQIKEKNIKVKAYKASDNTYLDDAYFYKMTEQKYLFLISALPHEFMYCVASGDGLENDTIFVQKAITENENYASNGNKSDGGSLMLDGANALEFQFAAPPALFGTIKDAANAAPQYAYVHFSNVDDETEYKQFAYMKDDVCMFDVPVTVGNYSARFYTPNQSHALGVGDENKIEVKGEKELLGIKTSVDEKSNFIEIEASVMGNWGEEPLSNPDYSVSYTYSTDDKKTWNKVPREAENKNPMLFHYGDRSESVIYLALAVSGGTNYINADTLKIDLSKLEFPESSAAKYAALLQEGKDTITISGVLRYVDFYDDKNHYDTLLCKNAKINVYTDIKEYPDILDATTANDKGEFTIKFFGKKSDKFGINITTPDGLYTYQQGNGSAIRSDEILSFSASLLSDENDYTGEWINEWTLKGVAVRLAKVEPPVLSASVMQVAAGEKAFQLEWEVSPLVGNGLDVDSLVITRGDAICEVGEACVCNYAGYPVVVLKGNAAVMAGKITDTLVEIESLDEGGEANVLTIGSSYGYEFNIFYKGSSNGYGLPLSQFEAMPVATLNPQTYGVQVEIMYVNKANEEFEGNFYTIEDEDGNIRKNSFSGTYIGDIDIPSGVYKLHIYSAGESYKNDTLRVADVTRSLKINMAADADANIVIVSVVNSEATVLNDAHIRVLNAEKAPLENGDYVMDGESDNLSLLLAKGNYFVEASRFGYATDTLPLVLTATSANLDFVLKNDFGETVSYLYGSFDPMYYGTADLIGKPVQVQHKGSGHIFTSRGVVESDGSFVFDSVSLGELTWIFPNKNLVTLAQVLEGGWMPVVVERETNDFELSNMDGLDSVKIGYGIEQQGFNNVNLNNPIPVKRMAFDIVATIAQAGGTTIPGNTHVVITSNKDENDESINAGEPAKMTFESFKGNGDFHFVISSEGFKEIDTTIFIKFREVTNTLSNIVTVNFALVPERQLITAEGTVKIAASDPAVYIENVIVGLYESNGTSLIASDTTDSYGGYRIEFQGFYNSGNGYILKASHPDYVTKATAVITPTENVINEYFELSLKPVVVMFPLTLQVSDSTLGTVTGAGSYESGTSVTVVATPTNTSTLKAEFKGWEKAGVEVSKDASYTFSITDTTILVAKFVKKVAIEESANDAILIYSNNGFIHIEGFTSTTQIEIFDMLGQKIAAAKTADTYSQRIPNMGLYVVRLTNNQGTISRKIVVK